MSNKKKKHQSRFTSRRQFLIGSGHAMMALPPLLSLMPSKLFAQMTQQPKVRIFTCVGVFGIDYNQMYPDSSLQMNATNDPNTNWINLTALPQRISRILDFNDSDLAGLESKTNLIRGLGLCAGNYAGHNHSILSGTHSGGRSPIYGESIDVIIEREMRANAIRVKTYRANSKADEFSFGRDQSGGRQVSSLMFGDRNLFNLLFPSGANPPPQSGGPGKDKLIVDKVFEDLQNLMSHQRLSQDDRNTLSDYIDGVQDVQKRIIQSNNQTLTCNQPSLNYASPDGRNLSGTDLLYDNYADLMVIAAQCDNAQVFHFANSAISNSNNNGSHPELHHGATGGSSGAADRQGWFLRRIARLAKKLDAITDPLDSNANSLLDNSIILWTNELGSWTAAHSVTNIPVITFGGGAGKIRTGQFMDFRRRPFIEAKPGEVRQIGRPYKQLLISMMNAAGLQPNQYLNVGDGNGFGEFKPTLSGNHPNAYAIYSNEHNNPLPHFTV